MTTHVVDASIFGPLFFEDEEDDLFDELPGLIAAASCIVPQHWRLEVTNQIVSGLRRKRTTVTLAGVAISQIELFPIAVDAETGSRYAESYALARKHGLTVYDAAYLELAIRRRATLVSYDLELRHAAHAEKVEVLPA